MPQHPPIVAVYARKSRFSENSESVANQVAMCKEHCSRVFPGCSFLVYDEDEGYSGKNTNRPSFQRLVADIKARKLDVLCCYRLDRISRSIRDFCALLDDLQRYNIAFVSLRDQFDTSTPMGRAMMYIASVFSQLERETIAERVRDSLYEMAKTGRWLGGVAPKGYAAQPVEFTRDGVARRMFKLAVVEDDLAQVIDLYQHFASLGSVSGLLTYCLQHGIKSQYGRDYSRTTLRLMLENPVYCTADDAAWQYFSCGDYNLCAERSDFDGIHGLMPFNRTCKMGELTVKKNRSEWIIAVGRHSGAVPGSLWVRSQEILQNNRERGTGYQAPRTEAALLSGVIRCGNCGSLMRPKLYGKPMPDGTRRFHYVCTRKIDSRSVLCDICNAPGRDVDQMVIQHLMELSGRRFVHDLAHDETHEATASSSEASIKALEADIAAAQRKIDNIVTAIANGIPETARARFLQQMEDLDEEIRSKQLAIADLTNDEMASLGQHDLMSHLVSLFSSFDDSFSSASYDERRRLIRSVVDSVIWDGENITISVLGASTLPK